ncbi:hypothetical protein [Homoserinimonas sp. OAct 916]|uniref:hypothetical protein n=1 Tax=Homoserinimonas sp. OAct 916 TaxID=2211450 RepID=UPI000DBE6729|nr:hypothetical protein [Homoserinimonas sp. OAct 916]
MAPNSNSTAGFEVFLSIEALAEAVKVHGETMVALATLYATRPLRSILRQDLMDATEHLDFLTFPVLDLGENSLSGVTSRFLGSATVGIPLVYGNDDAGRHLDGVAQLLHLAQSWARSLSRDVVAVAGWRIMEDEDMREDRIRVFETLFLYVDNALAVAASLGEVTLGQRGSLESTPEHNGRSVEAVIMTACITGIFRMMADQGEEALRAALQTAIVALLESWGYKPARRNPVSLKLV